MKKILYIHQYFKTPLEPGGTRSYWFSQELVKSGYQVVMVTSRDSQNKLVERVEIDGATVVYIRNKYDNCYGILRRLFSFIRFMLVSTIITLKEKNVSLVYATSTPLTIGVPALLLKVFKKINYIFEVRDLWPEVPIQMGALKNKLFRKSALWLESLIYRNAVHIIALSPGMQEGVLHCGIKKEKVSMIPNMAKIDKFYHRKVNRSIIEKYDLIDNKFYVIHFGAMGLANGLEYIVEAAKILLDRGNDNIEFLLVGGGSQKSKLKSLCIDNNISNIKFLGKFNMTELSEIVNISDCSLVSFLNLPILETNSPNKLFDSLSAQKPIIVNSAGWTKDLLEKYECGAYVDPLEPIQLVELLTRWSHDPDLLKLMGINSRKLAENTFDKDILSKEFVKIIKNYTH